ncbi:MAG: arylesterase [Rhodocyclaceae bacterium]|nr:arylesterase [Rhodocyclaceae bacterium]
MTGLRSIAVFIVLSWAGLAQAATILVWGDSLSAGYGLRAEQAWPSLLENTLRDQGREARVVNGSISGETTAGGRSRLPDALARHHPDILVLALGANDGLRGLPARLMRGNLEAMIRAAQDAGSKVLLVGMRMPPNYGPAYAAKFQETFEKTASTLDVPLLPFLLEPVALDRSRFQSDGLHPTAEAQPALMRHVLAALRPLLDSAP